MKNPEKNPGFSKNSGGSLGVNMPSQRVKLPLERRCLRAQTPQLAGVPILEGIPTHDTRAFICAFSGAQV